MAYSVSHLIALLLVALSTSASSDTSDFVPPPVSAMKRGTSKYCGRNLAEAISVVCNGVYNSLSKKSSGGYSGLWFQPESGSLVAYLPEAMEEAEEEEMAAAAASSPSLDTAFSPFRSRQMAGQLLGKRAFQRHIRGAYDECCRKPCSVKELSGYCGTGGR